MTAVLYTWEGGGPQLEWCIAIEHKQPNPINLFHQKIWKAALGYI